MTDYTELVKALREYSGCRKGELARITSDAAAAIEELEIQRDDAIATVDVLDKTNDRMMKEIEALLKENKELIEDHPEMVEADGHWEWRKPNGEVLMPKRGKWINSKERMRPDMCSVCGCVYEADRFMDKIAWNYCPNCGARMDGERREA